MADPADPADLVDMADMAARLAEAEAQVARLTKVTGVLMDQAERGHSAEWSGFGQLRSVVALEEQVRRRTGELQAALEENQRINRSLRLSEARFHGLVAQSGAGISIVEDGVFSYANPTFDAMWRMTPEELIGRSPLDLVAESDRARVTEELMTRLDGVPQPAVVFRAVRGDGTVFDTEVHTSTLQLDGHTMLVALCLDVTERLRAQREIDLLHAMMREESLRDPLTGLWNRRHLEETLERELLTAEREGHPVSVVLTDVDHFKAVNDGHGHLAGDAVLQACADVLHAEVRGGDVCCRYGGDELLVVLPGLGAAEVVARAEAIRRAVERTEVVVDGVRIPVTASLGVATYPYDGRTADQLVAAADRSLYAAKAAGRNAVGVR